MKRAKILTAIILAVCFLSSNLTLVYANESNNYVIQVNQLALDSPKDFPTTSNWVNNKIIDLVPLYDMNNSLYAYCVDIVNKDTGNYAYMIILTITDTPQILEFHPNASSPYMNINDKKAYYNGLTKYYTEDTNDMLQDLTTGDKIDKNEISMITFNNEKSRSSYNSISGYNNLTGVPDYPFQRGCVPTSLGMMIKYRYGNSVDSQTTLIDKLADKCETTGGGTHHTKVKSGVNDYLYSKNIIPLFCGWMSESLWGNPDYGVAYNSLYTYQIYINSDIPVMVSMLGSYGTSPAYPNGFLNHSVCGTGYYVGSAGEYIIVHTTEQEGDIFVAYSEYALGAFAWFTLY